MTAPDKIWIAGPASECGHYYPNATEAEGEHGSQAVEYTRSDLIAARPAPAIEPQGLGQSDTIDSFCLTLRRLVSDAYAERDRFGHIAATIRINALHNGATNAEVDAMLSGDVSFVNWIAAKVEALAARPAADTRTVTVAQLEAWIGAMEDWDEGHAAQKIDEILAIIGDTE